MAFFDEPDIIQVYSNTYHIVSSSGNPTLEAVLYSIISGTSISKNLLKVAQNQMSILVDNYYKYGKNQYTLGLPEIAYSTSAVFNETDVANAIALDTNRPYGVLVDIHYVAPLVPTIIVAPYLFTVRGWNPQTNVITKLPVPYDTEENLFGYKKGYFSIKGSIESFVLNEDYTQVTITYKIQTYRLGWTEDNKIIEQYPLGTYYPTEIIPLPSGLCYGRNYCIASYYILDSTSTPGTVLHWWYYDIESKKYAALINENIIDESNNFLPIVPIRYNNLSMNRDEVRNTELFKTSQKLLKKIGLDMDAVTDSLESNDSIADIDDAYIMFGVDLQTEDVNSIRYLAEFFDFLSDKTEINFYSYLLDTYSLIDVDNSTNKADLINYGKVTFTTGTPVETDVATNEISWTTAEGTTTVNATVNNTFGSFEEYGLSTTISFEYIRSDICVGSIGPVGHATKTWTLGKTYNQPINIVNHVDDSILILKVQIAANAYKKVTVQGLVHWNHVHKKRDYVTTLSSVIKNENVHKFLIPLHYNLSKKLPQDVRNGLYSDSLVIVINAIKRTSVEWYETSFFTFIVLVVATVISIYSGQWWIEGLAIAAQAGVTALLLYLLETVVISLAVSIALDYISEWVGPEVMVILALAVMVIAGAKGLGYLDSIVMLDAVLPSAIQLLNLSVLMLSSANRVNADLLTELTDESSDFTKEKEKKWQLLEDMSDLLESPKLETINLLDAQTYSSTLKQYSTNSPGEFYDMAIHTGNIGTLSLAAIPAFFDLALTLPKQKLYSV